MARINTQDMEERYEELSRREEDGSLDDDARKELLQLRRMLFKDDTY